MAVDSMYLENLDEFINDENKIVTYKWLSRSLQVHVNQAKQMLYHFVEKERNKKDNDHIGVCYLVAGLTTNGDGTMVHKVEIVPEEKLEVAKSVMKPLTSCHVYSVQKKQPKDTNGLYLADYDLLKEHIFHSNKYSAIKCTSAKLKSKEEMSRVAEVRDASPPRVVKTKPVQENGHSTSNGSSKAAQKKDIANMFAKASKKKNSKDSEKSPEVKTDPKKSETSNKGKAKAGGVMSFFAKQAEKPKVDKKISPKKKEDNLENTKKEIPKKEEPKKPSPKKPSPKKRSLSPVEKKTQRGKKKKSGDSDGEDPIPQQKKRRRIQQKSWESSSEEEEEEEEEQAMEIEEPIPSPPPREPTPEPPSAKPAEEEEEDDIIPGTPQPAGQRRRKQRRKLVPKTYVDEDGFMVTEKVWETESTDASENEDPVPKPAATKDKPTAKEESSSKKEKVGKKKPSPQKKSPGKSKQTSLTNFFKKK